MFIFEKETESKQGRGDRERGGQRIWSRPQALSCQHRAWWEAQTHKMWDHDLSQSQMLNWLSHPGVPWPSVNIWGWTSADFQSSIYSSFFWYSVLQTPATWVSSQLSVQLLQCWESARPHCSILYLGNSGSSNWSNDMTTLHVPISLGSLSFMIWWPVCWNHYLFDWVVSDGWVKADTAIPSWLEGEIQKERP